MEKQCSKPPTSFGFARKNKTNLPHKGSPVDVELGKIRQIIDANPGHIRQMLKSLCLLINEYYGDAIIFKYYSE